MTEQRNEGEGNKTAAREFNREREGKRNSHGEDPALKQ
jgi:hypothetical protein